MACLVTTAVARPFCFTELKSSGPCIAQPHSAPRWACEFTSSCPSLHVPVNSGLHRPSCTPWEVNPPNRGRDIRRGWPRPSALSLSHSPNPMCLFSRTNRSDAAASLHADVFPRLGRPLRFLRQDLFHDVSTVDLLPLRHSPSGFSVARLRGGTRSHRQLFAWGSPSCTCGCGAAVGTMG